jgi:uncharacterized protein DUF4157
MTERIDAGKRKSARARRGSGRRSGPGAARGPAGSILDLQHAAGNRAVGRAVGGAVAQRKLKVGSSSDPHEREADRVADAVVGSAAGAAGPASALTASAPTVQRKCACEDEELAQGKDAKATDAASGRALESRMDSVRGGGQPLDPALRHFFEPRLGQDFTGVKVHTDGAAAEAAQAISARAFTVGRDIVFGAGEWTPETPSGRHLLAHELAHVVQQGPLVRRQPLAGMEELPGMEGPVAEGPAPAEDVGAEGEPEEMTKGECAGGARRLDYAGLRNHDEIEFTVPKSCRRVKVVLKAMWDCDGCEWGPEKYTVAVDGVERKLPAGTEGIEEECTGTGPKKGTATFSVKPGTHTLRITTGRHQDSSCRLQLSGSLEILQ